MSDRIATFIGRWACHIVHPINYWKSRDTYMNKFGRKYGKRWDSENSEYVDL